MHSWRKLRILLAVMLFYIYEGKGNEQDGPIISIKYGQLKGKTVEVKGTEKAVYVYQTIPFGKPPVGSQRFSPPGKAESWKGVRDAATIFPPMCVQPGESFFRLSVLTDHSGSVGRRLEFIKILLRELLF